MAASRKDFADSKLLEVLLSSDRWPSPCSLISAFRLSRKDVLFVNDFNDASAGMFMLCAGVYLAVGKILVCAEDVSCLIFLLSVGRCTARFAGKVSFELDTSDEVGDSASITEGYNVEARATSQRIVATGDLSDDPGVKETV
jgi:hypothetical protein